MLFCTNCGNAVSSTDTYCARCGARQPAAPAAGGHWAFLDNLSPRTASLLCYIPVCGWLAAIIVLAASRFRQNATVRFHAFQSLYLFVAWLIVDWVIRPMFQIPGMGPQRVFPGLLQLVIFGAWIFMIIKVNQGEQYRLPIVGELADKSVSEQR